MVIIGGADKAVVGNVHQLPQVQNAVFAFNDAVNKLLGSDACLLGLFLYLLTVLIGAGEEHYIVASQSLVPCKGVGCHGAVGVADMQFIRGIVYRCCNVKGFLTHLSFLLMFMEINRS